MFMFVLQITLNFDSPTLNLLLMDSAFMFLLQMTPYLLLQPLTTFLAREGFLNTAFQSSSITKTVLSQKKLFLTMFKFKFR